MPLRDKEKLQGLMQKLFAEDSFAYTILGNKPVSWETYQNPFAFSSWENFFTLFSVMEYYKDKDFLEATLSLLAGHCP